MTLRPLLLLVAVAVLLIAGASIATAANTRGVPFPVTWFDEPGHERGAPVTNAFSTQQRGYYSSTARLHTRDLTPGHLYTIWWVVFNAPAFCTDECGAGEVGAALDTGENPAGIGVLYGGRFVAGADGKAITTARLLENMTVVCATVPPFDALCNPLLDAAVAETILFVNDHGPAPGEALPLAPEMFSFGCRTYSLLGEAVATYGATGYDCFTSQAVYLP